MLRHLTILILCCAPLAAQTPKAGKPKPFKQLPGEVKVFELTNRERKKAELKPLVLSTHLSKIARAHSENMARQGKMEHVLDEKTPFDRMADAGYKYLKAGENIASYRGGDNEALEQIMKAWMESKLHRENIVRKEFTEIGIGIARDKEGRAYITQAFGTPLPKGK
ncbi:MAG: CAP domain-containing protein [Planctomycetes bacterium]|nr:CAP domain-containing protein [Planctomycetota bacterium]